MKEREASVLGLMSPVDVVFLGTISSDYAVPDSSAGSG